jgi:hypothetical protein
VSQLDEGGVIFGDGIEADRIAFQLGECGLMDPALPAIAALGVRRGT